MNVSNSNKVLTVQDLRIGYKSKKSLSIVSEQINFQLKTGELVGLVGANGIGKSTLIRTICKMQQKLGGSILLKSQPLNQVKSEDLAKQLSVVLTEAPASKNLTVIEFVSLGRQPYTNWIGNISKSDEEIINKALLATSTQELQEKKCFELSDGQFQRVAIARALAQDTEIIILDEPTTHLDLYHRATVLKLLKQLATEHNKTIIFSTHEIDLAIQLSDKILVMTPTISYFDSPKNLIKEGRFDALFPKEIITFNHEQGKFNVRE